MTSDQNNVFDHLHKAYEGTGYVEKNRENKQQNYNYAGEAEMIRALRPALHKAGFTVRPVNADVLFNDSWTNQKGTHFNRIVINYIFEFSHKDGGSFKVAAVGEGVDTMDKAAYKAATGALKYALRQALLVETGDDAEEDRAAQDAAVMEKELNLERTIKEISDKIKSAKSKEELTNVWSDSERRRNFVENNAPVDYQTLRLKFKERAGVFESLEKQESK